ncbi:uncharacterized protein LOC143148539 [Ptiloglossa arizonensis]|uniref:uncharacterized protein LOC143148539 n=1 Tax=Ptiloglossa arizonensis TaxID=3350558 RepID=UPI003F9F7CEA
METGSFVLIKQEHWRDTPNVSAIGRDVKILYLLRFCTSRNDTKRSKLKGEQSIDLTPDWRKTFPLCRSLEPLLPLDTSKFKKRNLILTKKNYILQLSFNHSVLQKDEKLENSVFDIPYYQSLRKYLIFLGQYPSQTKLNNKIKLVVLISIISSMIIPTLFEIHRSIRAKDWDGIIECLPHLIAAVDSFIKLLSLQFNRANFREIFNTVKEEWEILKLHNEVHYLDVITGKGSKIAQMYRICLLSAVALFTSLPLFNPVLDIIVPLNVSRKRNQILKVYYFVDNQDYFYIMYLHLAFSSVIVVVVIVTVDSLYMIITHHASGMFTVCGSSIFISVTFVEINITLVYSSNSDKYRYKVKKATENNDATKRNKYFLMDDGYEEIRQCVIAHKEAIRFFKFLDEINRNNYLIQMGLNMMGISITAFQTVIHLNEPTQAFRHGVFFLAQKFHLFILSLPGQVLVDHSLELTTIIYASSWYCTPIKMQKILRIMQMRSNKPCALTAGGLYEMNIENFGMLSKTCMSYFTMMLSMKK